MSETHRARTHSGRAHTARAALEMTEPDPESDSARLRFNPGTKKTDFKAIAKKLFPKLQNLK